MMMVPSGADLLAETTALPPERRLSHLQQLGHVEPLLLTMGDEAERLATVEVARAVTACELVVALADEGGTPVTRARARRAHAQALAQAGQFFDALALAEEAARIAEEAREPIEAARAKLASLHALASLSRFDEAIAAGEAARAAFVAAGKETLAARADINLGATHQLRDKPHLALLHFDRARAAFVDDPVILAQLETNRGNTLMSLDDFSGAEVAFMAAVPVFEANGLGWAAAIAEGNLAYLAMRQGRLERSLYHFERARRHLEADEAGAELARLLAEQADAFATLGLLDEARTTYERVLPELEASELVLEAAHARAGLGRVLVRLGQLQEAERVLAGAATAFEALGQGTAQARVDLIRAELAAGEGRLDQARALVTGTLEVLRERPAEAAVAHYHLARLALIAGDLPTAAWGLDAAMPAAERLQLAPLLADLLHLRGLLHRGRGEQNLALADLRSAVAHVERVRGTLQAEQFRAAFLGNRLAIYADLVVQALSGDGPDAIAEAFSTVERAKSRALLDLVSGALDLGDGTEPDRDDPAAVRLQNEMARLRAELNWCYSQLTEVGNNKAGPPKADDWHHAVQQLERDLEALQNRMVVSRGAAGHDTPPVDLATAQSLVPAGGALIEYFLAGDQLMAFVLHRDRTQVFRSLARVQGVVKQLRRVRFQIDRALVAGDKDAVRANRLLADARRELMALDAVLLAPLRAALGDVQRLVIIPHGPLHAVPFHALWDGQQYLIERAEVLYAPSASLLAKIGREDSVRSHSGALIVGVPDEIAPLIADETRRVAAALGTDNVLLGPDATVERVTAAAQGASVVHLACHGRFSPESPLTSGIKLANRWMTVRDNYKLRLPQALVTLSACDTGRNVVGTGDELVGLVRSFLAAGASSLVMSLWTVNDESAAIIMTHFYGGWRGGASPSSALRHAQCIMLEQRPHPAFWAPFILEGSL